METEDIGFWLFMPSWNKDHLSDMPCNLNQIILGLYSSTKLPCIPFLPKPLNFPPIIFCYWNWCLSVSLCHLLVWVRGSNMQLLDEGINVSLVPGFPQPHLIQAIVNPILSWMLTVLYQNLSRWCRVNPK